MANSYVKNKITFLLKNNFVLEKNCYFQKQLNGEKSMLCILLQTGFTISLIEMSYIPLFDSAFILLICIFFIKVCKENPASQRYVARKGKSILVGFVDNHKHSSLILNTNS